MENIFFFFFTIIPKIPEFCVHFNGYFLLFTLFLYTIEGCKWRNVPLFGNKLAENLRNYSKRQRTQLIIIRSVVLLLAISLFLL